MLHVLRMAQPKSPLTAPLEIQESLLKIPKLHRNGNLSANAPLRRLKMLLDNAIIPSRGYPLTAAVNRALIEEIYRLMSNMYCF